MPKKNYAYQDALTPEQGETLLTTIVDFVDQDIDERTITGYLHGFVDGAVGNNYSFPDNDADEEYGASYARGYVQARDSRQLEGEAVAVDED